MDSGERGAGRATGNRFALAVALACFAGSAVYAQTQQSSTGPGAEGAVAGHVPEQLEQAEAVRAIVTGRADAPPRWWAPGEGRAFPEFIEYANASGALGLFNSDSVDRVATIEFGGVAAPDQNIVITIPARSGITNVLGGHVLLGSGAVALTTRVFASAANVITCIGWIMRVTP